MMGRPRTKYFHDVPCEVCGTPVKPYDRLRKNGKFNGLRQAQRFCSRSCTNRGREKKIWIDKNGYPQVTTPDGRQMAMHRHVMEKKIGRKLLPGETVHHKDGDRKNYAESNLELWASRHGKGQRASDLFQFRANDYVLGALSLGG